MSTLWTPAEITTALWLDADDSSTITLVSGAVSEWRDKSGNSNHVSQATASSRPSITAAALNSRDVMTFDSDFLGASLNLHAGQWSVFAVAKSNSASGTQILIEQDQSPRIGQYIRHASGTPQSIIFPGGSTLASSATVTNWNIYGVTRSDSEGIMYANGTAGSPGSLSAGPGGASALQIGARAGSFFWLGDVAEIVFLSSVASTADRQLIEGYLAWRWGLQGDLPADHPYKSAAPTLPDETSTGEVTGTSTATASGSSGSTGAASRLTPLGLFLVRMSLPDEANTEPVPQEADPNIPEFWSHAFTTNAQQVTGTDRFGYRFEVVGEDLVVNTLSLWGADSDVENVRIHADNGDLIAEASVTPAIDAWVDAQISPVTLQSGQFYVVSHWANGASRSVLRNPDWTFLSGIEYDRSFASGDNSKPFIVLSNNYGQARFGYKRL